VRSIVAGADLVLLGPDRAVQGEVHEALVEAVRSGRISEARVQDALARVERVAKRYRPGWERTTSDATSDATSDPTSEPAPDYAAHRALAREVATRGATLLWNDGVLPLDPAADVLVVAPRPSLFGEPPHLGTVLERYRDGVKSVFVGDRPSAAQIAEAVAGARDADVVVLASYFWMGGYPAELQELAQGLVATSKPIVLVSLGNPDDLRFLPFRPQAYLAVYGYRESNLEGASAVLTGEARPQGKLPVPVGDYPIGSGLEDF
ncbi:MAG: glycoside hydrolase family 3 C-terminal domain-containing protein, partial [Deinococcota bacterium]|nr:glycoside hydrolase family 3 C-terminal domain-containing protein [Deinococcota bacterium]